MIINSSLSICKMCGVHPVEQKTEYHTVEKRENYHIHYPYTFKSCEACGDYADEDDMTVNFYYTSLVNE